jgi:hypothetical protein
MKLRPMSVPVVLAATGVVWVVQFAISDAMALLLLGVMVAYDWLATRQSEPRS